MHYASTPHRAGPAASTSGWFVRVTAQLGTEGEGGKDLSWQWGGRSWLQAALGFGAGRGVPDTAEDEAFQCLLGLHVWHIPDGCVKSLHQRLRAHPCLGRRLC